MNCATLIGARGSAKPRSKLTLGVSRLREPDDQKSDCLSYGRYHRRSDSADCVPTRFISQPPRIGPLSVTCRTSSTSFPDNQECARQSRCCSLSCSLLLGTASGLLRARRLAALLHALRVLAPPLAIQPKDPSSFTRSNPNGTPYPNNIIPRSLFDPVAVRTERLDFSEAE